MIFTLAIWREFPRAEIGPLASIVTRRASFEVALF
jgi:hypothetical protein